LSIVLAVMSTLAAIPMFLFRITMAERELAAPAAGFFALISFSVAIGGLAIGIGGIGHRSGNPPWIWVGVVWNGIVVSLFLLLIVVCVLSA